MTISANTSNSRIDRYHKSQLTTETELQRESAQRTQRTIQNTNRNSQITNLKIIIRKRPQELELSVEGRSLTQSARSLKTRSRMGVMINARCLPAPIAFRWAMAECRL